MGTTYPRQAPRVSLQETAYFEVRNWAFPVARALLRVATHVSRQDRSSRRSEVPTRSRMNSRHWLLSVCTNGGL